MGHVPGIFIIVCIIAVVREARHSDDPQRRSILYTLGGILVGILVWEFWTHPHH
jgi:hypothetical protein